MKSSTFLIALGVIVLILWLSGYVGGRPVSDMITTRPAAAD